MTYETISEIRDAHAKHGGHFFDRDTLAFFDSQIGRTVFGGRYFLTSEQFHGPDGSEPRRWTIRRCNDDGSIDTVGDFQQFGSVPDAVAAVRALAEEVDAKAA